MSYCLNPDCGRPQNPAGTQFCQTCGLKLLLKERYRAIKVIGQGGFGRTFLTVDEDKPSKSYCVIKQFFSQAQGTNNAQKAAELFEQEAVRLDELGKHPQIPELLAYFTQDSRQYLVQEFIDGQNLIQVLKAEGAFSEAQIRDLLNSLLPVLEFIHAHNIIHRDIKPDNIIRCLSGKLVLVDFGAAKFATETALARTGTVIGSAGYAAPEQAVGKAIFASDLYSLGMTCIHLLTQTEPFDLYSLSEAAWVWREYLTSPVSDHLSQMLDKMLQIATGRRYPSATEVLQELNLPSDQTFTTLEQEVSIQTATLANFRSVSSIQPLSWRCIQTLNGHSEMFAGIRAVAISPDGQTLASGSEDFTIKLWNLETGQELCTLREHSSSVVALSFSPDGKMLVSGSDDKAIKIWCWQTGQPTFTFPQNFQAITAVAISPDGQILATGSKDRTIKLWELKTGQELFSVYSSSAVYSLAIASDNQTLASSGSNEKIELWDLRTGQSLRVLLTACIGVYSLAISPDGQTLAAGLFDGNLELWNCQKG